MKSFSNNTVNIANEKIGIGMIAASLAVIVFAIGIFVAQQKNDDQNEILRQGSSLARLLSHMTVEQLTNEDRTVSILGLLEESNISQYFAYASVVDVEGVTLAETAASGVLVPHMQIPQQPSQWVGQSDKQMSSGALIKEFFAPVMEKGELSAFIRLGYVEPSYGLDVSQVRLLAILAMAIFMLTPIFYLMIKNEIKPLTSIGTQLQALIKKTETVDTDVSGSSSTHEFMQKFSTVVEAAYNHIDTLEARQTNSVVSCKLLVYQKARMESALNALPFGVVLVDESGQITFTSHKIHELLGTREGEILGCNISDICENREVSEYLVRCQTGSAVSIYQQAASEIYLPETDKRVTISPYPLYSQKNDKQLLGAVIVFRDTTDEVVDQKQNGEFIAHVAHELKSPLNVLHMYSEILQDSADNSREMTVEAANVIHDETGRISLMIDNLLNLTMIEMGSVAIHRQRVKIGEFLDDIYQTLSHDKQIESLVFILDVPHDIGTLSIDKDLIRVAINNLIGNAVKYNRPGGKIELIAEENDSEVIIRVRDTGIGILEQDQKHIFEKFYRSDDDEVRERTGHGLGLSLVYETIMLHNGNIQLNSTHGEGSEFVMSFNKDSNLLKDAI